MSLLKIEAKNIQREFPTIIVQRSDVSQFLTDEELALFSAEDLEELGANLREHFVFDWFPDELKSLAWAMVQTKLIGRTNE